MNFETKLIYNIALVRVKAWRCESTRKSSRTFITNITPLAEKEKADIKVRPFEI